MCLLSKYTGSFCEIKMVQSAKIVCTGYIKSVSENGFAIKNAVFFAKDQTFNAIVSVLSQTRGLQVFKTQVLSVTAAGEIEFDNLEKVTDVERRTAFRAVVDLPALVVSDKEPGVGYDAIIKDISVKGISLWVHKAFSIDDIIRVQFPLTSYNQTVCDCQCNVVRAIGSNMYSLKKYGCDFAKMTDQSLAAIQALMTRKRTEMMQQMLK